MIQNRSEMDIAYEKACEEYRNEPKSMAERLFGGDVIDKRSFLYGYIQGLQQSGRKMQIEIIQKSYKKTSKKSKENKK